MKTFIVSLLVSMLFFSCDLANVKHRGNEVRATRSEKTDPFDEIRIEGGYAIELVRGDSEGVFIDADENLLDLISVDVMGRTLVIGNVESLYSPEGIKIVITYTELEEIEVDGACALTSDEPLKADDLKLKMDGAGAIDLDVDVRELIVDISGAGAVELKGNADYLEISMSGAGGLSAFDLLAKTCSVEISGIGSADINVENTLDASISGLGGIAYKGDPEVKTKNVSGLGNIHRAD